MYTPATSAFARLLRQAALGLLLPAAALAQAPSIVSFSPATAAPGATVTVTGTALTGFTSVILNGQLVRATAGAVPASTLSFIVPAGAGTGRIRLTTAGGTAISSYKLGVVRASSNKNYAQLSTSTTSVPAVGNYSTPTAADLNNNGLIEMIVGQGNGTLLYFEQATANTSFPTTGTVLTLSTGGSIDVGLYAKPTVSDLDGDGLQEIIVGEETGKVMIYEQVARTGANAFKFNAGTVLFANPYGVTPSGTANFGSYARPAVADINGNGLIDIMVGGNDGVIHRYEQATATATTTAGFNVLGNVKLANGTTDLDAGDVSKPLVTDYDGDGKLDMLVGNVAGNVQLYTQTAINSATFTFVQNLSTAGTAATIINMSNTGTNPSNSGGYAAPAVTDIDGNGLLDLFIGNGSGTLFRYEQSASAVAPTISAPLPVVLSAFGGQATSAGNRLSWTTAQELKSASFVVEASADGTTFAAVAELAAAGNSTTARSYEYLDASAAAQTASRRYYRLRQVDLDGTLNYSPVVTLTRTAAPAAATAPATAEAYPNPFTSQLSVALPGTFEPQAATATLFTLAGRPVFATKLVISATPQALAGLPELPAGVYVLRLTTAGGSITRKVTRQ